MFLKRFMNLGVGKGYDIFGLVRISKFICDDKEIIIIERLWKVRYFGECEIS